MSRGISADDLAEGSIAELEIGTRVWERPETDGGVSIENGRVFDVVRVWNIKKRFFKLYRWPTRLSELTNGPIPVRQVSLVATLVP